MKGLWRRVEFRVLLIAFNILLNSIIADSLVHRELARPR